MALLDGRVTLNSFSVSRLQDPAMRELLKKVRVVREPEFAHRYPDAMPTRITVRTMAGRSYRKQVDIPLGHPRQPMSDLEVENKFRRLASGRLDRSRINQLIDVVWKLDRMKNIVGVISLLKVRKHGS